MTHTDMEVVETSKPEINGTKLGREEFSLLVRQGILTEEGLHSAEEASTARGIELETILIREYGIPRRRLLEALSDYYGCPFVEYDERMPIAPDLLEGIDSERLTFSKWFPVMRSENRVIIAARTPADRSVREEVKRFIKTESYEFWVTLGDDIQWFIQDFLHARPEYLIGTERTGLAFWRNTMAQWRTRLACYRNDLAEARTRLALLRWGLGFIAISDALMRTHQFGALSYLYWITITAGLSLGIFGLSGYIKIRRSRMKPPRHQTLVEVTSATLHFLENYHFIDGGGRNEPTKQTMLARLGDHLADHCTILFPSPASRERTHLVRERNVLAAQRTVAACYRTIYARARTGLAFIRSGVAFSGLGLGLIRYFGFSLLTIGDAVLVVAGVLMLVDGTLWYMPVRKEQAEIPRCPVPQE
jgi:uncharacterized membrane protein YidH (DUF202 family)